MRPTVIRLAALLAGAGLINALFVTWARTRPDGAVFLWTSVVGACGALALYGWNARSGDARGLRWPETVGLAAAGATLAHLVVGVGPALGDLWSMVLAVGSSLTLGGSQGLLLGAGAALVLYGVRGPPGRRVEVGREKRPASGRPSLAEVMGIPEGEVGREPPEDSPPSTSDLVPRLWSGVAAGIFILAAFIVPLIATSDPTAILPTLAMAVAIVPPVAAMRMSRRGRSPPVLVQALGVALLAPLWGFGVLLLMGSPVVVTSVVVAFAGATILVERAVFGRVGGDEEAGDAPGGGAGDVARGGTADETGAPVPEG